MNAKLNFRYDREADIFYIDKLPSAKDCGTHDGGEPLRSHPKSSRLSTEP
jgi:hypothetical protein